MTFSIFLHFFLLAFSAFNLISINTQGLRSDERRQSAFNFFRRNKYDIIYLQETHWTPDKHQIIQSEWKGTILFNDGSESACGVAILFTERLDYNLKHVKRDDQGRTLAALITFENIDFNLINIYAPRSDTDRRTFYADLDQFLQPENNILAGDFNSIDNPRMDKLGGDPDARNSANKILSTVSARFDLLDIWRNRNRNLRAYTWTGRNTRDHSIIRTRIDKFLVNRTLSPLVIKSSIDPYAHSDHDIISLSLDVTQQERGQGFWHFNNTLLHDPIFTEEVTAFWSNWLIEKQHYANPLIWWDKAKKHFKDIAIKRATQHRKIERNERQILERRLTSLHQQALSGSTTDIEKYLLAKEKLKQFELKDLEATKLRAKARFLEEGERSTRYFYSLEKRQQANHTIKTLTRDNLDTISDTRDIVAETYYFYKNLYTAENTDITAENEMLNTHAVPSLPEANRLSCDDKLTESELHKALLSMENNKSPGNDGLTTNFYKHFWNIFGSELTKVYNYAFEQGSLSATQRRGVITLLYKKGDRTRLKNWRPITLLTTDYKILSKALANRLRDVLHLLVHSDQTACIPGRTINDNVSLIRDAINFANETNTPLALVAIDQLKAFDRVSHSFLHKVLTKFGFGPTFRRWIQTLYTSTTSTVKVNGWLTKFINMERGLRQGCALSMPLYILTAEILAIHIRGNPLIQGISPKQNHEVKLSQYADDTTLLLKNDQSVKETFNTLHLYERASGAKVNKEKCQGLWSGALIHRTDALLNFQWFNDALPDKILGLFFGNTDCTRLNLEPRIQKICNTISAWKHRDLSYKGKTLVINGLLTSTLWYTATSTSFPPWAIAEIEHAIYDFFWDNKSPLTTRDILALPVASGGFNLHRIQAKIEALRLNTLRRLLEPSLAHWKTFTEHFLRVSDISVGKLVLTTSYSVAQINKNIPDFHQELLRAWSRFTPHLARTNLPLVYTEILEEPIFRSDLIQYDGQPLFNSAWIAAGLVQIKDICYVAIPGLLPIAAIHEMISTRDGAMTRTLYKTTQEFQRIINSLPREWLQLIYSPASHPPASPQPCFTITQLSTDFSRGKTRLFYQHIMAHRSPTIAALQSWRDRLPTPPTFNRFFWRAVYPPLAPNRIGDLNWKIVHRILPTSLSLYRMTVFNTPNCRHCGLTETIEHLLIECPQTKAFWSQLNYITDKLTDNQVQLSPLIILFGYIRRKNDPLAPATTHLLNWILSISRYALHKSAVEYRLRNSSLEPYTIFKIKVKNHLTQQYNICKLKQTTYYFPYDWGIRDALVTVSNSKLVFNL